jgi:hypothetical protein
MWDRLSAVSRAFTSWFAFFPCSGAEELDGSERFSIWICPTIRDSGYSCSGLHLWTARTGHFIRVTTAMASWEPTQPSVMTITASRCIK